MSVRALRKKFIGDKAFYAMVLGIAVPMVIQNIITNFVNLLDNIMVGQIGTEQMSGVAIANQLLFVYNLCMFGGLGGAGIFTAQFNGKGDDDGIRYTMRFKMLLGITLTSIAFVVFTFFDEPLIRLWLHDGSASGNLELTLHAARQYLKIMLIGLIPFALSQIYSSTLREIGQTKVTMKAGITAVFVNLVFNWLLIYGHLGFPALGIMGAAVATVLSRIVECAIVVFWLHTHGKEHTFVHHVWRSLRLPGYLVRDIIVKGMPLLVNEALWSMSMTVINQCYSTRGLAAVAAINISSTIVNLFNVVNASLGGCVGIIVGKLLGQGKFEEAVDTNTKLTTFAVVSCAVVGWVLAATSGIFPAFYNTTDEVRELAAYFIRIVAFMMPVNAFTHCAYYTLRCGGKTIIVFIFDCVFIAAVTLPIAYILAYFTGVSIRVMYLCCQLATLLKAVLGIVMVRRKTWVNNIVGTKA